MGVPNEDAGGTWYFKNQGDKRIVFTNKPGPIEISDPTNKKTYRNTFRDALNFIRSDNKAGEYIIKLLVPRDFISADANALRDFSAANVTKLIITADTGSGMENNRHRLRSRGVTTLTMPQSTEVEFNNIAIRDIQNYDVRGGRLTFGDNVAIIGAAANVIGRVADTNIVIRSGNFNNVNGNGTASHTGTANVAVFGGTITELVGSTNKNGGISHITLNGATVRNLSNFDTLRVQGNGRVDGRLNYNRDPRGFEGRVIFDSGSNLRISGNDNQAGSLEIEAGTTGGTLMMGRQDAIRTPIILRNTTTPLDIQGGEVTLTYTQETIAAATSGDILLTFGTPGQASTEGLLCGIPDQGMVASTVDGNIRLGMPVTLSSDAGVTITRHESIREAMNTIGTNTGEHIITVR